MANFKSLENLVLSFPGVTIEPHFDKISFRVNKRIILTYSDKENKATLKLSKQDQESFSDSLNTVYPVPNKWGEQGWTIVELDDLNEAVLFDLIKSAYQEVSKKK